MGSKDLGPCLQTLSVRKLRVITVKPKKLQNLFISCFPCLTMRSLWVYIKLSMIQTFNYTEIFCQFDKFIETFAQNYIFLE